MRASASHGSPRVRVRVRVRVMARVRVRVMARVGVRVRPSRALASMCTSTWRRMSSSPTWLGFRVRVRV